MCPALSLGELREQISERQRDIVNDVWAHIKLTLIGLPERPLLERFGKQILSEETRKLSGTIIYSGQEENKLRYNLGLVGIFLTSSGPALETLIQKYLLVIRGAYEKNREIETFTSSDLKNWSPDLTPSELTELRLILARAYGSFASRLGGWNEKEFFVSVENEVIELKNVENWTGYVHPGVMKRYDRNLPVSELDRSTYSLESQSGGLFDVLTKGFNRSDSHEENDQKIDVAFMADDLQLQIILEQDWHEAHGLMRVKAWKSCVLLCGGIIEGLLLWQLEAFQRRNSIKREGVVPDIRYDGENLSGVLRRSKELGLVAEDELFLMDWARVYRNIIHPGNQRREARSVEKSHAELALKLVLVVTDNVRKRMTIR